jgi:hypothetical protein
MKNNITDILARLLFVLWMGSGLLGVFAAIGGWDSIALAGLGTFAGVIVFHLLYILVRWIFTGESD